MSIDLHHSGEGEIETEGTVEVLCHQTHIIAPELSGSI